jgi:hypothetical protein
VLSNNVMHRQAIGVVLRVLFYKDERSVDSPAVSPTVLTM